MTEKGIFLEHIMKTGVKLPKSGRNKIFTSQFEFNIILSHLCSEFSHVTPTNLLKWNYI